MKRFLAAAFLSAISLYAQAGASGRIGGTGTQLFVGNPQTSTYQTIQNDFQFCKTIPVSSGTFTITLMNPAPVDGMCARILNYGTGTITISRNSLTINGAAADYTVGPGTASAPLGVLIRSNGTNYDAQPFGLGGGASNCCGLPSTSVLGTLVGSSFASLQAAYFSNAKGTCSATTRTFWPVAGYFVSPTVLYSAAQTSNGVVFPFVSCSSSGSSPNLSGGGVVLTILDNAAGGAVDTYQYDGWHAQVGALTGIGELNVTSAASMAATFVADSGSAVTVLGVANQTATTASTTQYLGFGGTAFQTSDLLAAIPLPFAGTFQNFAMCDTTSPTATVAVALRDNGSSVGTPGTVGFTLPLGASGCNGWDPTNTYTASAGDYVDLQLVSGVTTQTTITWGAIGYTPSSGTPEMIWGQIATTGSTTTSYATPMVTAVSTTEANVGMTLPRACTASNLYIVLATNEGGTQTLTVTLRKNNSNTALTGTIAPSTTAGVITLDVTHTVALAQGDKIDVAFGTNSGVSGSLGGWAFQCQ